MNTTSTVPAVAPPGASEEGKATGASTSLPSLPVLVQVKSDPGAASAPSSLYEFDDASTRSGGGQAAAAKGTALDARAAAADGVPSFPTTTPPPATSAASQDGILPETVDSSAIPPWASVWLQSM
jgi:hypothetical protein